MKLELKHLAPYLPYGINITKDDWGKIFKLDNNGTTLNCVGIDYVLNVKAKPILRPIADLYDLLYKEFSNYKKGIKYNEKLVDLFCYENIRTEELLSDIDLSKLPYECIEFMFRNHYDFFGLIENNLAININNLKPI
jgi:hypothetical protein